MSKLQPHLSIPWIETQSPETIKSFQEKKLKELLVYLQAHSPYYRQLLATAALGLEDVQTLEDLAKIPITTKEDLQAQNNAFLCVPQVKVIDYVNTSGTLGKPVNFGLTEEDINRLAYNEYLSLSCTGGHPGELYQLTATMDKRFMAGLAYFLGARMIGAGIIRMGSGVPAMQWETIENLQPTAIIGVPSFILKLLEFAELHGINYQSSSVKKLICIGENIRQTDFSLNNLGKRIQEKWNVLLYSTYASTEMGASFTECEARAGGHHHPELVIYELLDDQDQPVAEGSPGEVTITTLGVQGMPLLRFKTGDICTAHTDRCSCGRTTTRLSPVMGRKKQMLKYKGTTLYPQSIYDALNEVAFVKNYVVESHTSAIDTDEIIINVSCTGEDTNEAYLRDHLRSRLRVAPTLRFRTISEMQQLQHPEHTRKPIIFIDKRVKKTVVLS